MLESRGRYEDKNMNIECYDITYKKLYIFKKITTIMVVVDNSLTQLLTLLDMTFNITQLSTYS